MLLIHFFIKLDLSGTDIIDESVSKLINYGALGQHIVNIYIHIEKKLNI